MSRRLAAIRTIALALPISLPLVMTAALRADDQATSASPLVVDVSPAESVPADDAVAETPVAMPGPRAASRAAREELARARQLLARAKAASSQARRAAEADARADGGYRDLQSAAARAASEYYAMRRPVLARLAIDRDYQALYRQRESAWNELARIAKASDKNLDLKATLPLATRALAAGERITRAESILLALDPAVEDARASMTDAFAALRRATSSLRDRIESHPASLGATEDVAVARARVAQANANLAAALKAEAEADRARRRLPRNG